MGNVQAIDVVPQMLTLKLGKIGEYSVVVEPNVEIEPREGYILVGDIMTVPDLITIRGNDRKIRGTTRWKTVYRKFEDITKTIETRLPLSDTLSNIIMLSTKNVLLKVKVQKLAEIKIEDVVLELNGAKLPIEHEIYPRIFDITIRGGINEIENLNYDDIVIVVNTTDIVNDTTGLLTPQVTLPKHIQCIKTDPPYLEHTKTIKGGELTRLK
jgi:YbbR domain-containing protein